ncbi:hypothetical protein COS75_03440 [Candidatus Pacearchaeota archaeon CG06_land_8_20_14_3_00_35_12]|nr:MAG: hypothetical protein COS75_03440 [Candidatus Pacearchaeota archaeon CG06_land_8_20_14_3_00_35_12]
MVIQEVTQFIVSFYNQAHMNFNDFCCSIQDKQGNISYFFLHPLLCSYVLLGGLIIDKLSNKKQENLEEKLNFSLGQDLLKYH